ncbi:MAG: nucleotidyl transferase [bacterium P3]|nr:MAG: nucleotidyl transferase [bacterium P3]KWW40364.1 MAG: nucleotidyl transferase [bacterium F083]
MQAFIPSAGLGTRLRPLTDDRPKALVSIGGKTLLERAIQRVQTAGAKRIVVNVHHHADQIIEFVQGRDWGAEICISDERESLLDTGGGLRHAAPLFDPDDPILIHNVDVLSEISLEELLQTHRHNGNLVTLAVSRRDSSRLLLFGTNLRLVGWRNSKDNRCLWSADTPAVHPAALAYSGIAVADPRLLQLLPAAPPPYPIVPEYVRLAKDYAVGAFEHDGHSWADVGRTETLHQLEQQHRRHGKFFT